MDCYIPDPVVDASQPKGSRTVAAETPIQPCGPLVRMLGVQPLYPQRQDGSWIHGLP